MKSLSAFLLLLCAWGLSAQNTDYFQQEVNYQIEATLDDTEHRLQGEVFIEYVNNSPDALSEIRFHLWPNAYKNTETAFAKQQARTGSTKFYFAETEKYGGFNSVEFYVKGKLAEFEKINGAEDMVSVKLPEPLAPGAITEIKIPYDLDIPSSFSRLGHVDQSYQMTQWYPKPAVYDNRGWHNMPYLDMGEFYSEYGRYEVSLTLPENYVVGATGTLQTDSEKKFLAEKMKESEAWKVSYEAEPWKADKQLRSRQAKSDSIPPSSEKMKTIRYSAKNVHDFAWFADKRFKVLGDEVELSSGKRVKTYVMFTKVEEDIWKDAVEYVNRSVKFYSDMVGEYPYPQATAVQSALSAGGGMEYPMVTVIGKMGNAQSLDRVITHEVGHNWFYGILGSNERVHPWMDEGMNSYYENRYMDTYYDADHSSLSGFGVPSFLVGGSPYEAGQFGCMFQMCNHRAQAPDTHSDSLTRINYGIGAYSKPALALEQLEKFLGAERFDKAMQAYYEEWKFRHPGPEDFRRVINTAAETDIAWLMDGFIYSTDAQNYRLKKVEEAGDKYQLTIENRGNVPAPFPINGLENDTTITSTQWFEGFTGEQTIEFPKGEYKKLFIDGEFSTLETDHRDNVKKVDKAKVRPLKLRLLGGLENPNQKYLGIAPALAYNAYDGFMAGLALHNYRLPERPFTFMFAPMYGTSSGDLTGISHLSYRWGFNEKTVDWIELGLNSSRFNYFDNELFETDLAFERDRFYLKARIENPVENNYSDIELRYTSISEQFLSITDTTSFTVDEDVNAYYELIYNFAKRRAINPWSLRLSLEFGSRQIFAEDQSYILPRLEWKYAYTYNRGKNINFRLYAGMVISDFGDRRIPGLLNLSGQGYSGYNDYKYEDWFFGRNDNDGLWSQQVSMREGGFKVAIPAPFASNGFTSNQLLVAFNMKADLPKDLPLRLPLKPYFDMAFIQQPNPSGEEITFTEQFWWNGGFSLEFFNGIFALNFPVISSNNLKAFDTDYRSTYFRRVTFMLDLKKLNPRELVDKASF